MDPSTFIFDDDFLTIRPGRLLASNVLYAAMSKLVSSRPGSVVLNPDVVFCVGNKAMAKDALAQLQAIVLPVSRSGDGQVFIPVLLHAHYTLAVVRHSNKTVRYYDSSPGPEVSAPDASQIVTRIFPYTRDASWSHDHLKCFGQVNGHDCGVSVFLNTMHLLNNPDLQDITKLEGMPRKSYLLYWLAGRTAILGCSKAAASLVPLIEKSLDKAQTITWKSARQSKQRHQEQLQALSRVCLEIQALQVSGSWNGPLEVVTEALQIMVAKWNT